jgi:hypothetical protein
MSGEVRESEMDKAVAIKGALDLLFNGVPPHIWVWALQQALQPTQLGVYKRNTVEEIVRQHADIMRRVEELRILHSSTPTTNLWEYPIPSTYF